MKQFDVTGMSCAACSTRVEKAVSKVSGVQSCSVNLLTNSMGVEGTAAEADIIKAVRDAGYGASLHGGSQTDKTRTGRDDHADTQTPVLKLRLISSVIILLILMYFSMGHMMWDWPLPVWIENNHIAMGIIQLLLSAAVMVINQKFFINGFRSLLRRSPNMDTLVALGSSASFVWSTAALLLMTDAQLSSDHEAVMKYMHEFYFESAAMIVTLITVGKMLEARSKGKTTDALRSLMSLAPAQAVLMRGSQEVTVDVSQVRKGDIFIVRPGQSIPVDGIVLEGSSAVSEAALTGESIPVDKTKGDRVSAATLNQSGFIRCEAVRVGEDTTLSQIIRMVSEAAATKAPAAKIADRVSGIFVPAVIILAVVTTVIWLILGQEFGFALARGISVLVISCPCALGLATPVAIMVGNGVGARNGILFKTAVSLENTGKINIAALDKTGTVTSGHPKVTDIIPASGYNENELLSLALALETKSEHPLAQAVVEKGNELGLAVRGVTDFKAMPGNGLSAKLDSTLLIGGSLKYISSITDIPLQMSQEADELSSDGKTPLLFMEGDRFAGIIAAADTIKEDSARAVKELKDMGIKVIMLTGDNERTAGAVGAQAGVDEVIAGVLPDGKESVIRQLMKKGKVAMVGDGINDAPALTRADIGIAIGAGTDVAVDAADVVLMKSSLADVPAAIRLSRAALRNIHQNLFWAFFYNVIGIPVAAGCFVALGLTLNPMFGAAAMSLSSLFVVSNALRLNLCRIHDAGRDRKIKIRTERNRKKEMIRTINIKGMMCGHCEARVKKALEGLEEVESAEVSHEKATAAVTLRCEISDEKLKSAVEDQDYEVTSIVH
ncbi:MAG: heavy metal translocating P-type ATPase [Oscillospiraceae bacterium]|nr:heavy metal translocating P-type ATPase [Oscillospiraceae bacterium]